MDPMEILFSFQGRLNRAPYWGFGIAMGIVSNLAIWIIVPAFPDFMGWMVMLSIGIASFWAGLALSVKRAHDRGRPGIFVLLFLIPIVNLWPLIELYFIKGTTGSNQYGPDPLM